MLYIVSLGDADRDNDEIRKLVEEWERRMARLIRWLSSFTNVCIYVVLVTHVLSPTLNDLKNIISSISSLTVSANEEIPADYTLFNLCVLHPMHSAFNRAGADASYVTEEGISDEYLAEPEQI